VLAPYEDAGRLAAEGPALEIGPNAATALTLVLHELATNAVKYGALSVEEGRLVLGWRREIDHIVLSWREEGGPPIEVPPGVEGFGSQLARKSVTGQLGGTVEQAWAREGLSVTITLPLERLER
jgi:two-component sensor histidine kinase